MSPSELTALADRVAAGLRRSADLMQKLHDGMVRRRTAWIAAKPSAMQEPATTLEQLAKDLTAETANLQQLFTACKELLPVAERDRARLHVDATLLATHLPRPQAARLLQAAAQATEQSRRVRSEQALGERLLRFSQTAHEGLLQSMARSVQETTLDLGGYDRAARRVGAVLPGSGTSPGRLVDGRM